MSSPRRRCAMVAQWRLSCRMSALTVMPPAPDAAQRALQSASDFVVFEFAKEPVFRRRPSVTRHKGRRRDAEQMSSRSDGRAFASQPSRNFRIGCCAQKFFFRFGPSSWMQMVFLQAKQYPAGFDCIQTAAQMPRQFLVRDFPHQFVFHASPKLPPQWTE